ncbi:radical SAM protein [Prolixibacteraceae bacterium]|nr:radical SAM protein [Prolixibacteraceae bacterium]
MNKTIYWSQYNNLVKSDRYGFLLFNSETNNIAQLTGDQYNRFVAIKENKALIVELDKNSIANLIKQKVLVYDKYAYLNKRRMHYYFKAFDTSNLGLAVAPTTACNFVCPYCYEGESKKTKVMDDKTIQDLISFIDGHKRTQTLNLTWYGGEPLMGFDAIKKILMGIQNINHLKLGLHNMTSNGYLLDTEKSLFFKEYPMNSLQITLDGAKEFHDKWRVLPGNKPTFDTIISNIDNFMNINPDTNVFVRMNLAKENISSFGPTYLELTKYWKDRNIQIYPAYVEDLSDSCKTECLVVNEEEKISFFKELCEKYGIKTTYKAHNNATGLCGATLINYYVVGPDGALYKCWNDLGNSETVVGYLDKNSDTIVNKDLAARYIAGRTAMDEDECVDCSVFPICTGNCLWIRHKQVYENKHYANLCCIRKNNLNKLVEEHYQEIVNRRSRVK